MKDGNAVPLVHVCRDCPQSSLCTECVWLGKLLERGTTLSDICENRKES